MQELLTDNETSLQHLEVFPGRADGRRASDSGGSHFNLSMYIRLKVFFLSVLSIGFFVSVSHADHLATKDQAKGKPEKVLAGINLDRSKIADVIKLYGKPSNVTKEPSIPNVVDTSHYYWMKGSAKLHVVVYGNYIALIEVEGSPGAGQIGRTGRGLKIGDDLADVRRIYGPKYKVRNIPERQIHDVEIQWRTEEYSLVAELNSKGTIKSLSLVAPE